MARGGLGRVGDGGALTPVAAANAAFLEIGVMPGGLVGFGRISSSSSSESESSPMFRRPIPRAPIPEFRLESADEPAGVDNLFLSSAR